MGRAVAVVTALAGIGLGLLVAVTCHVATGTDKDLATGVILVLTAVIGSLAYWGAAASETHAARAAA